LTTTQGNLISKALEKSPWAIEETGGLKLIRSPQLEATGQLVHAFTTRHGGNTPPPLDSFNLARHWHTEESRADAMANRAVLCAALGLSADSLTVPGQVHSTNIFVLEKESDHGTRLPDFDGVVTDKAGWPILLHFADCVPVMLFDARRRALAVIHAGWRGTAGGIAARGVEYLRQHCGCQAGDIIAAVGPAIGSCCYETGESVPAALCQTISKSEPFITRKNGKPHPDLKAINAMQVLEAGVQQVDVSDWCTACHPEIFYSHRQSGGKTGRQGALACIR
jgi:YfiH family protein